MERKQFLSETDDRDLISKIVDMVVHDGTPTNQRLVALGRMFSILEREGRTFSEESKAELVRAIAPTEDDRRAAVERFMNGGRRSDVVTPSVRSALQAYSKWAK